MIPEIITQPCMIRADFAKARVLWESTIKMEKEGYQVRAADSGKLALRPAAGRRLDGRERPRCVNCLRYARDWRRRALARGRSKAKESDHVAHPRRARARNCLVRNWLE